MALALTRKVGQSIVVDGGITITVVSVDGRTVRLAIEAPDDVKIMRSELLERGVR